MEIGNKIKQLRYKASLTQEQLAERLGLSAQAVSKWENAAAMPDITLLPDLAEIFGVSIDELFDLTADQKIRRIENRMEVQEDLTPDVFREYEDFLKDQAARGADPQKAVSVLAHLYYYQLSEEENLRLVQRFKELAGDAAAMEVEYGRYPRHVRDKLAAMAEEYDLMPSAGSDYHAQAAFETLEHQIPLSACARLADYIAAHCRN